MEADAPVFLLIAGGTPQMTTMLLLVGAEAFGARAAPLYVSQDLDRAHHLDITRQLYRQAFGRTFWVMLRAYAYPSALALLKENAGYIEPEPGRLLEATLHYANARSNLDLLSAAQAFDTTIAAARSLRGTMRSLQQEAEDRSEVALLRETIFLTQIAARTGRWADFLARLYRFSEGCLQLMAEDARIGVQWSDPQRRTSYARDWWDTNRALLAAHGLAAPEQPANADDENRAREADRTTMRTIIAALAIAPEHELLRQALAELASIDRPVPLRNNIVHRFTPLSQSEVEQKAGVPTDELLAAMRRAYQHAFGQIVPAESPYDSINRLCAEILRGER